MKKMKVDFIVDTETAVRAAFDKFHAELGYPKILKTRDLFPDYELEDRNGKLVRAEAEHCCSGAKEHANIENECDLIICWEDDWPERKIPCLELSRHVIQQQLFHGFEKNELDGISDRLERLVNIGDKTRDLLDDLSDLVKTDEIHPYTSEVIGWIFGGPMELRFWLDGWKKKNNEAPVGAQVEFSKPSEVDVFADIPLELVQDLSADQWKDIAEELKTANFVIGVVPTGEGVRRKVDASSLATELKKQGRVESLWFYYCCPIEKLLYETPQNILEKLNDKVVWLLEFINKKKLALSEKS